MVRQVIEYQCETYGGHPLIVRDRSKYPVHAPYEVAGHAMTEDNLKDLVSACEKLLYPLMEVPL